MTDTHPNEVPEFAHTDHAARRREIAAAGPNAHEHLEKIKKNLKLPNLVSVRMETETQSLVDHCPDGTIVRKLLVSQALNQQQQILKEVLDMWGDGGVCRRAVYQFGIQFTGYGSYCMSFDRDVKHTNLIARFFSDVAAYGVNFHRTMLFLREWYENPDHPENMHRLLLDGNPVGSPGVGVNPLYLENLNNFVIEAKARGIVVQVCLFVHHAVAPAPNCEMPQPIMLGDPTRVSPHQRYALFFNTRSNYLTTQGNFIDAVIDKLKPHWNVIYEIGNELRVPQPDAAYNDNHLNEWIQWVARRIRARDTVHLIGTSTGIENEALVNRSDLLQYCSFHQGQWTRDIATACRHADSYGHKHLIADDDGGKRNLPDVTAWVRQALEVNGGCRGSYNHKGGTMANEYNPRWLDEIDRFNPGFGSPRQVLEAFKAARANAHSPCARPVFG